MISTLGDLSLGTHRGGLSDRSQTAAVALNTQEVSALGPSIRLNDDSGDRGVTGLEAPVKGISPKILIVTYAGVCLVSPGQ